MSTRRPSRTATEPDCWPGAAAPYSLRHATTPPAVFREDSGSRQLLSCCGHDPCRPASAEPTDCRTRGGIGRHLASSQRARRTPDSGRRDTLSRSSSDPSADGAVARQSSIDGRRDGGRGQSGDDVNAGRLHLRPIHGSVPRRVPFMFAAKGAAPALGIARSTIDSFVESAAGKPARRYTLGEDIEAPKAVRDDSFVQDAVGRAETLLAAARAYYFDVMGDLWGTLLE